MLCLVARSCPILCDLMDCSPPGSSVHGDSPGKNIGHRLPCPPPGNLPNPGIEPRSPTFWVNSSPSEPPGKPMITAVGSLSLLQGIFATLKLNQGLLHCRWFLYQLSNQGSPQNTQWTCKCKCVMPGSSPGGSREFKEGTESAS